MCPLSTHARVTLFCCLYGSFLCSVQRGKLCQDFQLMRARIKGLLWQFRAESCRLLEMRILERWQLMRLLDPHGTGGRSVLLFHPLGCTVALRRPCVCQIGAKRLVLHLQSWFDPDLCCLKITPTVWSWNFAFREGHCGTLGGVGY